MTNRVVVGALMGALLVFATGCEDECADQFDCTNKKGSPAQGKFWACVDNTCEERDQPAPPVDPVTDGGGETDGGTTTPTDAGTDAGTTTDAGTETDAGTQTDAGMDAGMNVSQGQACTASGDCMAGLRCEGATAAAKTCEPLHIALTVAGTGNAASEAVALRHTAGSTLINLSEAAGASSRPRWSRDGNSVAYVEAVGGGGPNGGGTQLVTLTVPPATATRNTLLSSTQGGTDVFAHLEWAPSTTLVWSRGADPSYSGISGIAGDGSGAVSSLTENGVLPSWAGDGNTFAYHRGGVGLSIAGPTTAATLVAGAENGLEPYHNKTNNLLLFLKRNATYVQEGFDTELFLVPSTGATAERPVVTVAALGAAETVAGGEVRSFVANPDWSPDGTWAAYTRTYFSVASLPGSTPIICGNTGSLCGGRSPQDIFLQRINPQTGAVDGAPIKLAENGTLSSFSPDGRFIAYVKGADLYVQEIDPATGSTGGKAPVQHQLTPNILTNRGDDYRPRWQPR